MHRCPLCCHGAVLLTMHSCHAPCTAASPRWSHYLLADGCRRPKRFLPFMEGQRSCAGQALATMNIPATLAMLYGRFSFHLADEVCE